MFGLNTNKIESTLETISNNIKDQTQTFLNAHELSLNAIAKSEDRPIKIIKEQNVVLMEIRDALRGHSQYNTIRDQKIIKLAQEEVALIKKRLNEKLSEFVSPDNDYRIHNIELPTTVYNKCDLTPLDHNTIEYLRLATIHLEYVRRIRMIYEDYLAIQEVVRRSGPYFKIIQDIEIELTKD